MTAYRICLGTPNLILRDHYFMSPPTKEILLEEYMKNPLRQPSGAFAYMHKVILQQIDLKRFEAKEIVVVENTLIAKAEEKTP